MGEYEEEDGKLATSSIAWLRSREASSKSCCCCAFTATTTSALGKSESLPDQAGSQEEDEEADDDAAAADAAAADADRWTDALDTKAESGLSKRARHMGQERLEVPALTPRRLRTQWRWK